MHFFRQPLVVAAAILIVATLAFVFLLMPRIFYLQSQDKIWSKPEPSPYPQSAPFGLLPPSNLNASAKSKSRPKHYEHFQKKFKILETDFINYGVQSFPTYLNSTDDAVRNALLGAYYDRYFGLQRLAIQFHTRFDKERINRKLTEKIQEAQQDAAANP